eukprot:4422252-Pyramimonas_sp.AAC.1
MAICCVDVCIDIHATDRLLHLISYERNGVPPRAHAVSIIIVGDFNVHHTHWLRLSHSATPEGSHVKLFAYEE